MSAYQKRKKKLRAYIVSFMVVMFITLLFGHSTVNAQETRSWLADFLNPTFSIKLTDGDVVFDHKARREEINNDINTGGGGEYSLYDRFGPDINFFSYCGEVKIQTNIVDKLYTFIADGADFSIKKAIDIFKTQPFYVNNRVYEERVDICNSSQDPRYTAWCNAVGLGGNASLGNFYLGFAKWLEDLEGFVISDQVSPTLLNYVESTLGASTFLDKITQTNGPLMAVTSILTIWFVINMARMAIKFAKDGSVSFNQILGKTIYTILAYALIWLFATAPFSLLPIEEKLIQKKQEIINETVDQNMLSNGVISGSENQVEAMLWFINIYDPWCQGTHDRSYYEMYTLFAEDNGEMIADPKGVAEALPMSDDNIFNCWDDGSLRYSCKYAVGDVKIPRGNGVFVRNWAALAYSMQSKYHIGAIQGANNMTYWPNAETTIRNPQLYVDDFRYIDGILNISEEYDSPNHTTGNVPSFGPNAPREYGTSGMVGGAWLAIYRVTILNIPLMLFALRILLYVIEMMFFGIQLIWNSFKFLVRFDEGPFQDALRNFVDTLLKWILMNIMLLFALGVYSKTYSTFFGNIAYMIICIVLWIEAPAITRKERAVQGKINAAVVKGAAFLKNKVTGNGYKKPESDKNKDSSWEDEDDDEESGSGKKPDSRFGFEDDDGSDGDSDESSENKSENRSDRGGRKPEEDSDGKEPNKSPETKDGEKDESDKNSGLPKPPVDNSESGDGEKGSTPSPSDPIPPS